MKKRTLFILAAVAAALALMASACGGTPTASPTDGPTSSVSPTAGPTGLSRDPIEIKVFRSSDMSQGYTDTLFVDHIREKFGITLKYTYVPSSVATEKLNLSFATNTYDDMLELVSTGDVNRLAKDDFIVVLSDHLDKLSNYVNAYEPADWKLLVDTLSDARNRLYVLPVKEARNSSSSYIWMFRSAEFESVGKPVPKTVEELYDGLKALKAKNPNLTLPNRWGLFNALEGFNLAFRTRFEVWKDPDAGGQIVYGAVTDKFRDLLKYMHRLYAEDILSKEFITMTSEQRMSQFSKGNVYANFQFSGYESTLNRIAKAAGLPEDWTAEDDYLVLTAYPEKGPMQQRWPAFYTFGVALTDRLSGENLDRALEYVNWSCSEEGQIFHEFGVEGESFEIKDGRPVYIGKYLDEKDPDSYFGLIQDYGPFGYYVIQNEDHAALAYPGPARTNIILKDVEVMDYSALPYRFTPEEESRQADLGIVLNQIRDEYIQSFIMGPKDPGLDADWNEYLAKMQNAGLDEYMQILRDANARLG